MCKILGKGSGPLTQDFVNYAHISPESHGLVSWPCFREGQSHSMSQSSCTGGASQPSEPRGFLEVRVRYTGLRLEVDPQLP